MTEDDIVWLTTKDDEYEYYTTELRERYHENEAEFYAGEFKKRKDPWLAVNASSHYRKCEKARTADSVLNAIAVTGIKNIKLKSAICTTHGGVKRDLGKHMNPILKSAVIQLQGLGDLMDRKLFTQHNRG